MRKETDLEQIKEVAKDLLMLDIKENEMFPMLVDHPFTQSGIVYFHNSNGKIEPAHLLKDKKALQDWHRVIAEQIDLADSAFKIHMLITKPYRITFLKFAEPFLSQKDFSKILSDAWICSENPNRDTNVTSRELLSMFRAADSKTLMSKDDYEQFRALDDRLTVYRGITSYNADYLGALSWTLDYPTAKWFAHRFNENGVVYKAKVAKEYVFAYFNARRGEQEVIIDPKGLRDISKTSSLDRE